MHHYSELDVPAFTAKQSLLLVKLVKVNNLQWLHILSEDIHLHFFEIQKIVFYRLLIL